MPGVPKFFLVDTPGFDDTSRSDSDVLKELAKHLAAAYKSKIILTGLIYLHRIMDTRFSGASGRNLRTFKKLTGDENLGSVVLATTFWKIPLSTDDVEKETQLNTDPRFGWSRMLDQQAEYMRQDENSVSAQAIIQYLIDRRKPVTLRIQKELVDQGKSIADTEAGAEVISEMRKLHQEQLDKFKEEMLEAMRERDKAWQRQIEIERAEMKRILDREENSVMRSFRERVRDWWDDCLVM